MSSGSPKKLLAVSKLTVPVPPKKRGQGKGVNKPGNNGGGKEELPLSPTPRPALKVDNIEMADASIDRSNLMSVLKTIKKERQTDQVIVISSDEAGESQMDIRPSTSVNVGKHNAKKFVESNKQAIQTRSSSGISKKRVIDDAAIFSDDDETSPVDSPPKKSRHGPSKVVLNDPNHDCEEDFDIVNVERSSGEIESSSASPLKLNQSNIDDNGDSDPFINDHDSSPEPPIKKSNAKGKKKFGDVFEDPEREETNEYEVQSVKGAAIIKAVEHCQEQFKMFQDNAVKSGSSTQRTAITDVPTRKTFKDLFPQPQTTHLMTAGPTLYEDTMKFRVSSLPITCEVDDGSLRDDLLSDDYDDLPPLKFGSLRPWSTTANTGMSLVRFSQWATQCPDLDFDNACNAVRFVKYKNFIGPSRISPLDVNILYTSRDFKRSTLQCNFKTAICLSPILSQESFLISASTTGLHNKYISGHFHQLEWERFEAFACMVFNKPSMIAQINNQAISFGTMGPSKLDREAFSSPSKYAGHQGNPRNPGILISSASTSVGRNQGKTGTSSFQSVLNYTDDVPIYDAREHPFNFGSDLENLSSVLPRYRDEIPPYSFVVVGYTLNHYEKDARAYLATNVQFAILFGCE